MKTYTMLALVATLVACGGGGGGGDDAPFRQYEPVSYHTSGGLQWSSTTGQEVISPSGLVSTLELTASRYCTEQTCETGTSNCKWTNFNAQPGWRLPTYAELDALYARTPSPPGWVLGRTWSTGAVIDFTNGQRIGCSGTCKAKVTCVKPA